MLINCLNVRRNKNKNKIRKKKIFFIIAPVGELVTKKSERHLELEQALEINKKTIYQLPSNSSILNELRQQTANLIMKLSDEIRREYKEQLNRRKS